MGRRATCNCGSCKKCYQREWARRNKKPETPEQAERRRERNRAWKAANPERAAAYTRDWYERNSEHVKAMAREREAKSREHRTAQARARYWSDPARSRAQQRARNAVGRAIAQGTLERGPCEVCGATPTHGHHDDYSRALEVRWLCDRHHKHHHIANGKAPHDSDSELG